MVKSTKILIGIIVAVIIVALGGVGWILFNQKNSAVNSKALQLPVVSQIGTLSTPGGLLGPQETSKAKELLTDKIIDLTNQYRRENNLPALTENKLLTSTADLRTTDMFQQQYFAHISLQGTAPSDVVLKTGYDYKMTGENIALGDFTSEKDLVDAWMASPGHRANILNPEYKEIGVAATLNDYQGRNTWIATQEFGVQAPKCNQPSQNLSDNIDQKKADYQSLTNQTNTLSQDAQNLMNQANQDITQGNTIYTQTHSKSKAKSYWTEGQNLQNEAQDKIVAAKAIDKQLKDLYSQTDTLINQFNSQVNTYNKCVNS